LGFLALGVEYICAYAARLRDVFHLIDKESQDQIAIYLRLERQLDHPAGESCTSRTINFRSRFGQVAFPLAVHDNPFS
jgi:hypothetical protein